MAENNNGVTRDPERGWWNPSDTWRGHVTYGNYCGPGWTAGIWDGSYKDAQEGPLAVDQIDELCRVHDLRYENASPRERLAADKVLIDGISGFLNSPASQSLNWYERNYLEKVETVFGAKNTALAPRDFVVQGWIDISELTERSWNNINKSIVDLQMNTIGQMISSKGVSYYNGNIGIDFKTGLLENSQNFVGTGSAAVNSVWNGTARGENPVARSAGNPNLTVSRDSNSGWVSVHNEKTGVTSTHIDHLDSWTSDWATSQSAKNNAASGGGGSPAGFARIVTETGEPVEAVAFRIRYSEATGGQQNILG